MSTMAWYPLPQSGRALSAGDEFFESQSAGWSLWSFSSSDDQNPAAVYPVKHESSDTVKHDSGAACLEDQSVPAPLEEPLQYTQSTNDMFLSHFSDEEMRQMDAPFETLAMFPDSMHRLQSYEDMLSGVLTGSSEDQDAKLDRNGVDSMDTCGFPLFSHDLQNEEPKSEEIAADTLSMDDKAGTGSMKRSRSFADDGSSGDFEALVLEELEDAVFKLTKKTRICFRDALFRLAETSSKARCSGGATGRQSLQQPVEGNESRVPAAGFPERETNAIDRTVADLMRWPQCPCPLQVPGSCCTGVSGEKAQSTTSSTVRA